MTTLFTILDAMILVGVNHIDLFDGLTPAQRIATAIFDDNFLSCIDKTYKEYYNIRDYDD